MEYVIPSSRFPSVPLDDELVFESVDQERLVVKGSRGAALFNTHSCIWTFCAYSTHLAGLRVAAMETLQTRSVEANFGSIFRYG